MTPFGLLRRLRGDRRGASALEFALISPLLLLVLVGVNELTRLRMAQRKVAHSAAAIGDLVAQSQSVKLSELDDFFTAGNAILGAYDTSTVQMRLTSVAFNQNGAPQVQWSVAKNMSKLAGSVSDMPPGLLTTTGDTVIFAETNHTYNSPIDVNLFGFKSIKGVTFRDKAYLKPRLNAVACTDCPKN